MTDMEAAILYLTGPVLIILLALLVLWCVL